MHSSLKTTRTGNIPSPQDFRAAATGIGHTLRASKVTGAIRAQRVIDSTCDPRQLKCRPPSYPEPFTEQVAEVRHSFPSPVRSTKPSTKATKTR